MQYEVAAAHLRMLGYKKYTVLSSKEMWSNKNNANIIYIYNKIYRLWDIKLTQKVNKPVYGTLRLLNDKNK
jgi:hypothetical protein